MEDNLTDYVWVDVRDAKEVLPLFGGVITVKILKIDPTTTQKRKIILRRKVIATGQAENDNITAQVKAKVGVPSSPEERPKVPPKPTRASSTGSQNTTSPASEPSPQPTPAAPKPANVSAKVNPPPAPAPAPAPAARTANLLDGDDDVPSSPFFSASSAPPSSSTPVPNFFDEDDPFSTSSKATSSSAKASTSVKASTGSTKAFNPGASNMEDIDDHHPRSGPSPTPLNRAELAAKKSEVIEDKVQNALDFKKEVNNH